VNAPSAGVIRVCQFSAQEVDRLIGWSHNMSALGRRSVLAK